MYLLWNVLPDRAETMAPHPQSLMSTTNRFGSSNITHYTSQTKEESLFVSQHCLFIINVVVVYYRRIYTTFSHILPMMIVGHRNPHLLLAILYCLC